MAIRLRRFETALEALIPPGFQIAARLDGPRFTRLPHAVCTCEAPFDEAVHGGMLVAATSC